MREYELTSAHKKITSEKYHFRKSKAVNIANPNELAACEETNPNLPPFFPFTSRTIPSSDGSCDGLNRSKNALKNELEIWSHKRITNTKASNGHTPRAPNRLKNIKTMAK